MLWCPGFGWVSLITYLLRLPSVLRRLPPKGGDARHARGVARPTFDPGDADHFAAAASPVLRGLPAGQRD